MQAGKGVDIVMNSHDLDRHFLDNQFDTVICLNTLEHDNKFWLTLEQINKVLHPQGYLIFCEPTYGFPIHRHPKDYWRILPDGLQEVIFEGYKLLDWEEVYSKIIDGKGVNPILCGVGQKL
jgi:2-polyprenyl-3-methyl-5-hydroxy-6-metoxy-1,4-benzoquinol methylase